MATATPATATGYSRFPRGTVTGARGRSRSPSPFLRASDDEKPYAIAAALRDDSERRQERRRLRDELAALRDGQPMTHITAKDRDAVATNSRD